jgi:peptide deformylase
VPECVAKVKRAEKVVVKGLDRDGKDVRIEADGLFARALQHEIDHLNGVIILDRISQLKRELYRKKSQKKWPGCSADLLRIGRTFLSAGNKFLSSMEPSCP